MIEKTSAAGKKYGDQFGMLSARMRCISSPFYASNDYNKLLDMDADALQEMENVAEDEQYKEYIRAAGFLRDKTAASLQNVIREKLGTLYSMLEGNQRLFDKDGTKLDLWGVLDSTRRGENIYGCDLARPHVILTIELNDKNISCKTAEKRLPEELSRKLQAGIAKEAAGHCINYDCFVYSTQRTFTEGGSPLVKEIMDKNMDYEAMKDRLLKHYGDEEKGDRSLSQTEYVNRLKKLGYNPKVLSPEEVDARRQLTVRAHGRNLDMCRENFLSQELSADREAKLKTLPINKRTFCAFSFLGKVSDRAYNESVVDRMCGTAEQKEQVVKEIYERHLAKLNMFSKAYTDEELVDNWEELHHEGVATAMEYDSFKAFVANVGIKVEETLQKQMDDACVFANASFAYYKARMDLIGSRYYKYGGDDVVRDASKTNAVIANLMDPEFKKMGMSFMSNAQQTDYCIGYGLFQNKVLPADKKIMFAVDSEGNQYDSFDYPGIGNVMKKGEPIYLIGEDKSVIPVAADTSAGIPPQYGKAAQPEGNVKKIMELVLAIDNVEKSSRNRHEKQLAADALQKHIALLNVMNHPQAADFQNKLKSTAADLCTSMLLKNMTFGKNMPEDILKQLHSEETFKAFRKDIIASGLSDRVADVVKANPDKLQTLSTQNLFRTMVEVQANQRQEKIVLDAARKQKKYKEFRQESQRRAEPITDTYRWAQAVNSNEYFFNGKVSSADLKKLHDETPLQSMTVQRNSVKSLTMALMLNQGYKPEEVFHPRNSKDREMVSAAAMAMIRAGDYKTIRENLYKGMDRLNNYISDKLDTMRDFSLSEMSKPQNRVLIALNGYLKDMNQEFDKCQAGLSDTLRLNVPTTMAIQRRAQNIGFALNKMDSRYAANDTSFMEMRDVVRQYVVGECYNKFVQSLMALPENRGKGAGKIIETLDENAFTDAYAMASADMILDAELQNKPETLRKIYDAIQDDTFKENLHIEVNLPTTENPELELVVNMDSAIEKAGKRELMDKIIDPSLDAPVRRRDDLVMN